MHCTCNNGALAVSVGHFLPHISERLTARVHDKTMVGRQKLSLLDRGRTVDDLALRKLARLLQVSPSVIVRLRQRFNATGQVQDRSRLGSPKKITAREDRYITG